MLDKERFAWAWLAGLIVVPAVYFTAVESLAPVGDVVRLVLLAAALLTLGLIALAARFLSPDGGVAVKQDAPDERDLVIELRSSAVAYQVLMAGMVVVGFVMPFSATGWSLVNAAFLAVIIAEVVHYALVLIGYRRGTLA